jgi:hypothetical protein
MKKIFLALSLFISFSVLAQEKLKPAIKQGSKLKYTAHTGENDVPVLITLDSITPAYAKIGWTIEGYGTGAWVMKAKSLETATRGYWNDPAVGNEDVLADEQIMLLFSKAQWNSIQKDKKADYDMQTFTVKEPTEAQQFKLDGKAVDCIMLEGQNGTTRVWVLNDASLPLILRIEGNTMGPSITLQELQ